MFQSNPAATEMYFQPSSMEETTNLNSWNITGNYASASLWEQIDTNGLTRASPH